MKTNKEKAKWLTGLLTGWGISESWAKIIAGAIIGALIAAGALTATGCVTTYEQTADGIHWQGAIIIPEEFAK